MDLGKYLESPGDLLGESEEIQIAIASFSDTPRSLLEVLMESECSTVVETSCLHVNYSGEIEGDYRKVVSEILQNKELGQNDRLAIELMRFAPVSPDFLSEWVPESYLIQGLKNEYNPLWYKIQLLERLSNSDKLEPRLVVAESEETTVSILEYLAGDLELAIRLTVELNSNCPSEVLELVKSQYDLARDWDTDVERLRELGGSRWSWIRLTVAQNPFAPEDILLELARDEVFKVRLAVGKNPSTGEEALNELFSGHKNEIKKRDNLPASILERFFQESLIDVLDEEYQEEYLDLLLEQPNTPTWILVELANVDIEAVTAKAIAKQDSSPIVENFEHFFEQETRFLREIAEHPQVSASILQDLTKYPSSQLKLAIAKNPKTPEQLMISLLQELFENSKYYIKIQIANNPKTPVIILEQLANKSYKLDGTEELLQELAPDITSNLLKRIKTFIYKGQSPEMILFGLGQFSADSLVGGEWTNLVNSLNESELKTLEYLSNQESPLNWEARNTVQTRSSRRRKPSFDNEEMTKNYNMLDGLMHLLNTQYNRDRTNQEIVAALLGNPSVPVNLRERLWERYKTTPDDESEYLEDWDMRMAVAFNPQTSEEKRIEYLQQLLSNQISHIGWFAGEKIHQKIAKNPLTPEFLLKFIVQNRRGGIQDVIKNPNAPVSILREAAKSDNSTTLGLVAEHPNTPKDLLQEMSSTAIVLKNPNLTSLEIYKIQSELQRKHEIQEAEIFMYKRGDNRNISSRNTFPRFNFQPTPTLQSLPRIYNPETDDLPTLLAEYSQSNNRFVRFVTLLHPLTPQEILNQGANSTSWLERYAVAENKSTPLETRSKLTRDRNRIVRAAANQY